MTQQPEQSDKPTPQRRASLVGEFIYFMKHHKKWWLAPILIVILLIGLLAALTNTGLAPFIYPSL